MLAVPELVGRLGECAAQQTVSWGTVFFSVLEASVSGVVLPRTTHVCFVPCFWAKSIFPSMPCCHQTQSIHMSCGNTVFTIGLTASPLVAGWAVTSSCLEGTGWLGEWPGQAQSLENGRLKDTRNRAGSEYTQAEK